MMQPLHDLIAANEERLMYRVLAYAKEYGYARYASTLIEAWRVSIAGLSASILAVLTTGELPQPIKANQDLQADPLMSFGMSEARRHRERGVPFHLFLGLMKYYRKAYHDLVQESHFSCDDKLAYREVIESCFDRMELGFSAEWVQGTETDLLRELQEKNLSITNEKNKFLTIFESLPNPVLFINYDELRVENYNYAAAALFFGAKTPGSNYYGGGDRKPVPPAIVDELAALASRQESTVRFEKQLGPSDSPHQFIVLMQKMLDISGKFQGYVVIFNDITALREMEAEIEVLHTDLTARAFELEQANTELEAFNYSVSHDLRAPLTGINGYCQLLLGSCAGGVDQESREYIENIHRTSMRMNQLITTLLNFSRLSKCEVVREKVDLSRLAYSAFAKLRMNDPERRVTAKVAEEVTVEGDSRLLQVVMGNLISNAWKYTSRTENAVIEFGVTERCGVRAYFVRDNGIGFPMTEAGMLFRPFHRLHSFDQFEGFGIGLATVERIIRRHGGTIWAEGAEGEGATFFFTL